MSFAFRLRHKAVAPVRRALERRGFYQLVNGPEEFARQNNTREAVDAFFADPTRVTEYLNPDRITFYAEVAALVRQRAGVSGRTVADVGCGTGNLLALFNEASERSGFDFSAEALRVAAGVCPSATFEQHDIYDDVRGVYDIVLCCEVLEHLLHPADALRRLDTMTVDSLFLTVPNGRRDTYMGHINFWSPQSWTAFIEEVLPARYLEAGALRDGTLFAHVSR